MAVLFSLCEEFESSKRGGSALVVGRPVRAHRRSVISHPVRLLRQWHVRQVVDRVERARRVCIEPRELGVEVVWRRALGGDEFEAFAQRPVRGQAGDQDLSELATRDDSVAGVAGVAAIPLQKHEPMLVWLAKAQSLQLKPIAETSTFPSLRLRIVLRPLIP
jgi:hypothetical protein